MRDSAMIYKSQVEALRNLPPEQFKAAVLAIWDYELYGIVPDGDPVTVAMWMMSKPLIDKRNVHYENGKKGGRPKNTENQNKPDNNLEKPDDNRALSENKPLKDKGKRIKEKGVLKESILSDESPVYPYRAVVDYLNEKAGTRYKYASADTRSHIRARVDQGFLFEDFCVVIDKKVDEWKGTDMEKYLRPSTLFGPKFESYLNQQITRRDRMSVVDDWVRNHEP